MTTISEPDAVAWQPLSGVSLANHYLRDLTRSAVRALSRRVRTRGRVAEEYHSGHWQRILDTKPWLKARHLQAFLVGDDMRMMLAKIGGRPVRVSAREYYALRLTALSRTLMEHVADDGQVVELGCGCGLNLFSLALADTQRRFLGLDISENGVRAGRAIAEHFGLADRVRFDVLDLTDPAHANFAAIRDQTVFTFCCIEQVPHAVARVIDNVRRHRPKRVINVEPTTELLQLWRPMDFLNYAYVKSVDYQTRLFSTLASLEARGDIRIVAQARLPWAPTLHNDTFLVAWEPNGTAGAALR
jgi:hypothetical protein